jgi:hypothetical protein
MEMKRPIKRNMAFYDRDLEDDGGIGFLEEEDYPIHYSNQTYSSSPKPRKFKIGKNKFLSEMLFDREPRKKTRVTH